MPQRNFSNKVVLCHSHRASDTCMSQDCQTNTTNQVLKELLQSLDLPIYIVVDETIDIRAKCSQCPCHYERNFVHDWCGTTGSLQSFNLQPGNRQMSWRCWDLLQASPCGVTDDAKYCKKAFRAVLSAVLPNSIHVFFVLIPYREFSCRCVQTFPSYWSTDDHDEVVAL